MDKHLEHLAQRVEDDPFFLGSMLRLYARSESLDDEKLRAALGCSEETLTMLRLCRSPREESAQFNEDIDRIIAKFQVNPVVLREAVRRGQTIVRMRKSAEGNKKIFQAARDGQEEQDGPKGGGQ